MRLLVCVHTIADLRAYFLLFQLELFVLRFFALLLLPASVVVVCEHLCLFALLMGAFETRLTLLLF